jgi:hypothetical protein
VSMPRFWKNIVLPGWYTIRKLGLLFIFLLLAIGSGLWAYLLQQVAFPQAGSSADQISATVYLETLPAHVNLQSTFTPSLATKNVSFTVTVTGPTKRVDPWLLVVQCATPPHNLQGAVPLVSESLAGKQESGMVLVRSGSTKKARTFTFTCITGLAEQNRTAATVVQNQDLNLSLPILEQNPVAGSALANAPVWAEKVAGKYRDVVEVQALPGTPCPTPSSTPSPASPAVGSANSSAGTPSPSPTASSSPSSSATTSATPSPIAPACYTPVSMSGSNTSVKYSFPPLTNPTTVVTSETLNDVKLSNERIDSMYPQGTVATDKVTWTGGAGLSPSLSATNLASAERQNKDAFWAGFSMVLPPRWRFPTS